MRRNGRTCWNNHNERQLLTLVGKELEEGGPTPDFEVLDNDLSPVKLSSFRGKVCVISSVLSFGTAYGVLIKDLCKFNSLFFITNN
jgi:peroxiredoxin